MSVQNAVLPPEIVASDLYNDDLAPVPPEGRTWNMMSLAAVWVGMAVCIPTYLLASYMIRSGMGWIEALVIIFLANLIVTLPMILNGHAGVKYGVPFPVLGRASFGINGVHIPSIVRGFVACGWFGIQTWIGGLAIYAIWCAATGTVYQQDLSIGKFIGFALFWLLNMFFIFKGTESIKWLEIFAAPILLAIGVVLIGWGAVNAGGFGIVLDQSAQLSTTDATLRTNADGSKTLILAPLTAIDGTPKASEWRLITGTDDARKEHPWHTLAQSGKEIDATAVAEIAPLISTAPTAADVTKATADAGGVFVQFRAGEYVSSAVPLAVVDATAAPPSRWSMYLIWLTAMVGFWATMSISIADITRYVKTQKQQVAGQLIGLPGTMLLYSFVGVFVTCAALILFADILVAADAPWDPVSLIARFDSPVVVIVAQIFMLIATLSTNIAANVIAPANAFANAMPKRLNFAAGGLVTGLVGIAICPWWLMDQIAGLLLFVSGLLGPVLGVLLADYYVVRRCNLNLADLYRRDGAYSYRAGFNPAALIALAAGIGVALIGFWVPALHMLYSLSWFTGFAVAFIVYVALMPRQPATTTTTAATAATEAKSPAEPVASAPAP